MSLGTTLQRSRKQQRLTQKQVADGICAQSMLSAIENDRYVPNAKLLLALCNRLKISLATISLAHDFDINEDAVINTRMQQLCNQHRYQELQRLLLASTTLDHVVTPSQTQAYYYYLAVTQIQIGPEFDAAQQSLKLALSMTAETGATTLACLATTTLALVNAKCGRQQTAVKLMDQGLSDLKSLSYDENHNVIWYLNALMRYLLNEPELARQHLLATITAITAHQSHYMLANCYRLLAEIAVQQVQTEVASDARQKQRFLTDLFQEPVPKKF
ncbi:helix-turn-helix transcriptional regulator [Lactiplantibacillus paraxiangfangensis]|uniref:helix-turn-helix domain-containing protein n=1 Tax=Lactiplantibacillus paraxiangfangensis TaxID=3076224 RepID=UPI0030C6A88B